MTPSPKHNRSLLERALESALDAHEGDGPVRVVVDPWGRCRPTNAHFGSDLELLSVTEILRLRRACDENGGDARAFAEVYTRCYAMTLDRRFQGLLEAVAA